MELSYTNWMARHATVKDNTTQEILYSADFHSTLSPHMVINSAATSTQIGSATSHSFSSKIDVTLNSNTIQLQHANHCRTVWQYMSPSLGSMLTMTSKNACGKFDFSCVDENGRAVAWTVKGPSKLGTLQTMPEAADYKGFMDEIMVMVMTMIHVRQKRQNAYSSAAAVAASS